MNITRLLVAASLVLITGACKKQDNSADLPVGTNITTEDVGDVIQAAVTPETQGLVAQMRVAMGYADTTRYTCGVESDTSTVNQNMAGAAITYGAIFNWYRLFTCTGPDSLQVNHGGLILYGTPQLTTSDSSYAYFTFTGLQDTVYQTNLLYERAGTHTFKVRKNNTFFGQLVIDVAAIPVNKTSGEIAGGIANVYFTGSNAVDSAAVFNGTLQFSGNKTAVLTLPDSSYTRTISWQ